MDSITLEDTARDLNDQTTVIKITANDTEVVLGITTPTVSGGVTTGQLLSWDQVYALLGQLAAVSEARRHRL